MSIQKRKLINFTNDTSSKFEEAVSHINEFIDAIKVVNQPTVYAVSCLRGSVKTHFPDLNLAELNKLYPKNSVGIRVYYGQRGADRMNYLVFTAVNPKKAIENDIVNPIYLVEGKFKIYPLSIDIHAKILSNHHSCEPDCPDTSILGAM